ncbi:hypothetical protein [Filimonas lacunae]|nr:hypothetical protein [Filimonas lacunae]BAV10081.1 hypothetical protein FLA_6136 [Filimonas lacunae]
MKTKIVLLSVVYIAFFSCVIKAQDTTINLDLLKAPASPGANLLGFATSDIEKPTDISAFMLSLQSATGSFSKLPSNYAIDLAPYWLLSKRTDFTTAGLAKTDFKNVFKQTLVVSLAIRNPEDSSLSTFRAGNTYGAIGFKFSLVRPAYDKETTRRLNHIWAVQYSINRSRSEALRKWRENDPEYTRLYKQRSYMLDTAKDKLAFTESQAYKTISDSINAVVDQFNNDDFKKYDLKALKDSAASFVLNRQGWSWDVAGGISAAFMDKRFDSSNVHNAGVWTTFGYTDKKGSSLLGIVRYLYNPSQVFAKDNEPNTEEKLSTLDYGVRYIYANEASKFSASMEALYRSVVSGSSIKPSWRLIFNADYAIWKNQKLTFSFGRNFDGVVSKGGNLVAALSFLTGFGNKR